jgi:hypothetical protein
VVLYTVLLNRRRLHRYCRTIRCTRVRSLINIRVQTPRRWLNEPLPWSRTTACPLVASNHSTPSVRPLVVVTPSVPTLERPTLRNEVAVQTESTLSNTVDSAVQADFDVQLFAAPCETEAVDVTEELFRAVWPRKAVSPIVVQPVWGREVDCVVIDVEAD